MEDNVMRKGIHPLSVHLGTAFSEYNGIQEYASNFDLKYSRVQLVEMVRGIKLYQGHVYKPERLLTNSIWQSGSVSILEPQIHNSYECKTGHKYPMLLIPSLINKSYILDLCRQRSLLRWLRSNGINAYLLDWGDIVKADKDITIGELINNKLCSAIKYLANKYSSNIDVLGYCMGGTLLVAANKFINEYISSIVFLASPWDFNAKPSVSSKSFARAVRIWSNIALSAIENKGVLPSSYVQALFASLSSEETVKKFIKFSTLDQGSQEAKFFVSVEDWLNDDVDIPKNIAKYCIEEWFIKNATFNRSWSVNGFSIDAADIDARVLIISSKKDKIVPYKSAMALKEQISSSRCNVIEAKAGHIGMIVGNRSIDHVWKPMLLWLRS